LQQVDLGFDGREVLTMEMRLLDPRYARSPEVIRHFNEQILARVRSLPGVTQASVTSSVPFRGVDFVSALPSPAGGRLLFVKNREVDPDYFALMRIPILEGRNFTSGDTATSALVVIVSESMARMAFPGQNAIGQLLDVGKKTRAEIVGIVADVRHVKIEEAAEPAYYSPRAQSPSGLICLVVRTNSSAAAVAPAIRSIIHSIDPRLPVQNITTLDAIVSESIADRRFYAIGTAAFAALALLLAVVGICGLVARSVIERTREIGVRVAFGAMPGALTRLVLRQALMPVAIGIVIGGLASFLATRTLRRFLFGVTEADPFTYGAVMLLVIVVSTIASYIPARRAAAIDPLVALRHE
jgi:putative ABC transport system permease protein